MRRFVPLLLLAGCPAKNIVHTPPPPDAATPAVSTPDAAVAEPQHPMSLADTGIVPSWVDQSADPCDDFFQYACGGFVANTEIPSDRSSWGAIAIADQKTEEILKQILEQSKPGTQIGDFYSSCMDEDTIEKAGATPLQPMFDAIAKVKDAKTAMEAVSALHRDGVYVFFSTWPTQDAADATSEITGMNQSGLGLPDRDYYVKDEGNMKDVRTAYRAHVQKMFELLGRKDGKQAADDVMRIETALAKMQQTREVNQDPGSTYHKIDRKGLEKVAGKFPWGDYLKAIGIGDVTSITVHDPKYYTGFVKLIAKEKPAALQHYFMWAELRAWAPHLSKQFVDEDFAMSKLLTGAKELPPRWRRCVEETDGNLGDALGQAYVAQEFGADAKASAIDMTKAVLAAMDVELDALPWMDDATRTAAKAKLAKMAYLVGYPDKWKDYTFTVSASDFAANVRATSDFEIARQLAKIGKPVDRFDWEMTPPTVNAYYEPPLNEIALPAGQLQPPFFAASFHPAVNFGSTGGGTIGHEMTHGFDDHGSQYDGDGNLKNWWSQSTKSQFDKATQCVIDQYGGYEAVPGVKLNGKLTLGENIADIGGVKIGYEAYQRWRQDAHPAPPIEVAGYTDDQLYFLAYGQSWCEKDTKERLETQAHSNEHSPAMWRVNGVIADQPGFAAAFQCGEGTKMNPGDQKRCTVW